jgi:hypothetical protein
MERSAMRVQSLRLAPHPHFASLHAGYNSYLPFFHRSRKRGIWSGIQAKPCTLSRSAPYSTE